ncbi:MAG: universal stress protein [Halobacteriales archaeon]
MTTVPADMRAIRRALLESISTRTDQASALEFRRRRATSRNAIARHELGLYDLEGLDDDVTIDHRGPPTSRSIDEILVPVAGGPNTEVALGLAGNIASSWNASITLLTVLPEDAGEEHRRTAGERLEGYADTLDGVQVDTRLETGDDVVAAITALTDRFELVVIGGSERSLFQRVFHSSIPDRLDRNTRAPIFVVSR